MKRKLLAACTGLAATCAMGAFAAFNDTDPNFHPAPTPGYACGNELAVSSDLSTFASLFKPSDPQGWAVAKFRPDGLLDAAWGRGGVLDLPPNVMPSAILPLPGGGAAILADAILRYDANGAPVASYGNRGASDTVTTNGSIGSYALQADGSIVVQGFRAWVDPYLGNRAAPALTRIGPDGRRDASFGTGGYVMLNEPQDAAIYAWSVAIDGAAEVASYRIDTSGFPLPQLHRYPTDFPAGGAPSRLIPAAGIANWLAPAVAIDASGGVVFSGSAVGGEITLTRFGADGRLDTDFGTAGQASTSVSGYYANEPTATHAKALSRTTDGAWTVFAGVSQGMGGWNMVDVYFSTVAVRFRADGGLDPVFPQGVNLGGWQSTKFVQMQTGELLNADSRPYAGAVACSLVKQLGDGPRADGVFVEYYHSALDHYFITVEGGESRGLDANVATMQWRRTGRAFGAWLPEREPGTTNLCRFRGDPVGGPSSHFYSIAGAECEGLKRTYADVPAGVPAWRYEGLAASVRDAADGTCPANLWPVYRLYNDGFGRPGKESNHRYTTDPALYADMQAKGWLPEGVHFCVPMPSTRTTTN